jgi:hypothetical protein
LADAWEVPLHCLHVIEEDDITDLAVALDQPLEALVERARAAATQWLAEALAPYVVRDSAHAAIAPCWPAPGLGRGAW